jgi:hypothetical protein
MYAVALLSQEKKRVFGIHQRIVRGLPKFTLKFHGVWQNTKNRDEIPNSFRAL